MTNPERGVVTLETIQLVVGSLIVGLVVVLGVVSFLAEAPFDPAGLWRGQSIWLATVSFFALAIVASVTGLSRVMIRQARSRLRGRPEPSRQDLLRLYFPYVIVRCSLVEGLGFFGAVVFLVSGTMLGLLLAIVGIAGLILIFPTRDRFRSYCDRLAGGPL